MEFPFNIGGPLNQNKGFILHSNDYKSQSTLEVTRKVKLTCSTDIICDIAKDKGPKKFFISLGYSGWGPGQLEDEIKKNSWINIDEQLDLLFDIDTEKKWIKAIKKTGIDFSKFSSFSGTASLTLSTIEFNSSREFSITVKFSFCYKILDTGFGTEILSFIDFIIVSIDF